MSNAKRKAHEAVEALKEIVGGSEEEAQVAHAAIDLALAAAREEGYKQAELDLDKAYANSSFNEEQEIFERGKLSGQQEAAEAIIAMLGDGDVFNLTVAIRSRNRRILRR